MVIFSLATRWQYFTTQTGQRSIILKYSMFIALNKKNVCSSCYIFMINLKFLCLMLLQCLS